MLENEGNENVEQEVNIENKRSLLFYVTIGAVAILVIVGLFMFFTDFKSESVNEQYLTSPTSDDALKRLETQGTSDEISDIEDDINLSDLEDLDKELEFIQEELEF